MRTLRLKKPPMTGPDVKALQKLLTAKGFKVVIDGVYSPGCADAVLKAKKTIPGYPFWLINRMAGGTFLKLLTAYKKPPKPKPSTRDKIEAWLHWALLNTNRIGYGEYRPMPESLLENPRELDIDYDCSTGFTVSYKAGGAQDPNRRGYDGIGNTTTLAAHGRVIPQSQIKVGDGVLFTDLAHIASVLEVAKDPILFSHGGPRGRGPGHGPKRIPLSVERTYHPGPVLFLRFLED